MRVPPRRMLRYRRPASGITAGKRGERLIERGEKGLQVRLDAVLERAKLGPLPRPVQAV
jgi:hypothetical protein